MLVVGFAEFVEMFGEHAGGGLDLNFPECSQVVGIRTGDMVLNAQ